MENKLGRGLSELLEIVEQNNNETLNVFAVNINSVKTRNNQPRKEFDPVQLTELADSIKKHGVLQPLVVRKDMDNNGIYQLIAGERRLRASKQAGLTTIPVSLIDCSEEDVYAIALIENIQRAQLNPIEEATAIQTLLNKHNCTQESLSKMISKSRTYITNSQRILLLPDDVKEKLAGGEITAGHAKMLVGKTNASTIAENIIAQNLSVRDVEEMVRSKKSDFFDCAEESYDNYENPDVTDLSERITQSIGLLTKIKLTKYGGKVIINCRNKKELESLTLALINIGEQ